MVIPFTYNVLKRHPALMVMINRAASALDIGILSFKFCRGTS